MLTFPDAHHLAHDLSARIRGGQLDDHTCWHIVALQRDSGELAHESFARADDLHTEVGDSNSQDVAQPSLINIP